MTIGAEGTMVCPFDSKKCLNESRISLAVIMYDSYFLFAATKLVQGERLAKAKP